MVDSASAYVANVRDYGALGDGVTDDTAAFQAAIDSLTFTEAASGGFNFSASGGTVYIPPGRYEITSKITINAENLCLMGGSGPVAAGRNTWIHFTGTGTLFELLGDWSSSNDGNNCSGFSSTGFDIIGDVVSTNVAFEIRTGDRFKRDFVFSRMGIHRMGKCIEITDDSGGDNMSQIGKLTVEKCCMKVNGNAIYFNDGTSCNQMRIVDNDITNNVNGSSSPILRLRGYSVTVTDNILEGQENALYCTQGRELNIRNNFFESNTGWAIRVYVFDNVFIGMNTYTESNQGVSDDDANMFQIQTCDVVYLQEPTGRINNVSGNTNIHDLKTIAVGEYV